MSEVVCRLCGGKIDVDISFGDMYVSDFVSSPDEAVKGKLDIGSCVDCGVTQLANEVNLDSMYKDHYWYRSGLNNSMLADLEDVVKSAEKFGLEEEDVVVDIGCNDGSLFDFYTTPNLYKLGFDPAPNVFEQACNKCNLFINDYFTSTHFISKKAKVITSIAMFYDLPDPKKFVKEISDILSEDGVWIIQFTDLLSMLKANAIDNICAEHLEYYRLFDVVGLVSGFGLEVFDVEYNMVNGGSVRIFVGFSGKHEVSERLSSSLIYEEMYLATDNLSKLSDRIKEFSVAIKDAISSADGLVYAMAASTKGNTLLQLLELDSDDIVAIGEINEDKFGLMTAGTNIPIVPEQEVLDANPALIIVLAWHFRETFGKVLAEYIDNGGKVLYPLPVPEIHSKEDTE